MILGDENLGTKLLAIEVESGRSVSEASLMALLKEQEYKCALSGFPLTPENCAVDHKTPLARGGEHSIDNIQLVTEEINAAKGQMTCEEFVAMCRAVVVNTMG